MLPLHHSPSLNSLLVIFRTIVTPRIELGIRTHEALVITVSLCRIRSKGPTGFEPASYWLTTNCTAIVLQTLFSFSNVSNRS